MIRMGRPVIGEEEKRAVLAVLESGQLAQAGRVAEFEEAFARFIGCEHAVAISSGTAALMVALLAHGIGAGDEVITTPFTFAATANAVLIAGARPVFVDVREDDFNIDPALIELAITRHTRAILPVHLFGHPCDMEAIGDIARRHGVAIIEDACQAHSASVGGQAVGSFGTGCFSLYATKNMTSGEGGMLTTDDAAIAERVRLIRNHGERQRYHSELLGYNFRMTEIAAALGLAQLSRLPDLNERRRANADYLSRHLRGVITPGERPGCHHVYHQYTVRVPSGRDRLAAALREAGVETAVFYPTPVHCQTLYRERGYDLSLPVAEGLSREVLSLPVHPSLSQEDLETIVAAVNGAKAAVGGSDG